MPDTPYYLERGVILVPTSLAGIVALYLRRGLAGDHPPPPVWAVLHSFEAAAQDARGSSETAADVMDVDAVPMVPISSPPRFRRGTVEYVSVKEMAAAEGVTERSITKRIAAGGYPGAVMEAGVWQIPTTTTALRSAPSHGAGTGGSSASRNAKPCAAPNSTRSNGASEPTAKPCTAPAASGDHERNP